MAPKIQATSQHGVERRVGRPRQFSGGHDGLQLLLPFPLSESHDSLPGYDASTHRGLHLNFSATIKDRKASFF